MKAFGCASYPLIMKDERKKVDATAKQCVLVVYGTVVKGYRLYDPNRGGKVIYSRVSSLMRWNLGLRRSLAPRNLPVMLN